MQYRAHDLRLLLRLGHDEKYFLLLGNGDVVELLHLLGAGALTVEHRAAPGACRPGRVHHQFGLALAGDDNDQLVREIQLRRIFTRAGFATSQKFHGFPSSYTFHGHGNDYAVSGHAQVQPLPLAADECSGPLLRGRRQHHPLLVGLNAQKIQHALYGRAPAEERHIQGQAQLLCQFLQPGQRLRRNNRDHIIHAGSSHSSIISQSP